MSLIVRYIFNLNTYRTTGRLQGDIVRRLSRLGSESPYGNFFSGRAWPYLINRDHPYVVLRVDRQRHDVVLQALRLDVMLR